MRKSKQDIVQEIYDIDSYSTPDSVSLYDTDDEYYSFNEGYDYYMAYPFYYNITEDKLIVGYAASTHLDMMSLDDFDDKDNFAKGRIWVTEDEEFSCVFALWNHERFAQYIGQLLCDYFSIDPTTAIYVEGDKLFYLIDMEEVEIEEQDEETKEELEKISSENQEEKKKEIQQIHLANQEAKREALADFRNDRDKNIADKIKDGGFESEAEYRFYNGLNEEIKNFRPDGFSFEGEKYSYFWCPKWCTSYVFIRKSLNGKLLVGDCGTHFDLAEYNVDDDELGYLGDDDKRDFGDAVCDWLSDQICGRIYVTPVKKYSCIITVWSYPEIVKDYYVELCNIVGADPKRAILLTKHDVIWLNNNKDYTVTDDYELDTFRQIHLANQKEKKKFFSQFKMNRDRNRAEKYKKEGWGNASQAEINFWRNKGLDESKLLKEEDYMSNINQLRTKFASINIMLSKRYNICKKLSTNLDEILNYIIRQPKFSERALCAVSQYHKVRNPKPIIATCANNIQVNDILNIVGTNRQFIKDYFNEVLVTLNQELFNYTDNKIKKLKKITPSDLKNTDNVNKVLSDIIYYTRIFNEDIERKYNNEFANTYDKLDAYFERDTNINDGVIAFCEKALVNECAKFYYICGYYCMLQLINYILAKSTVQLNAKSIQELTRFANYAQNMAQTKELIV